MTTTKWIFSVEDKPHEVVLKRGPFAIREIWLDGQLLKKWRPNIETQPLHYFDIDGCPIEVGMIQNSSNLEYYLLAGNQIIEIANKRWNKIGKTTLELFYEIQTLKEVGKVYGLEHHPVQPPSRPFFLQAHLIGFLDGYLMVVQPGMLDTLNGPIKGVFFIIRYEDINLEKIEEIRDSKEIKAVMKELRIYQKRLSIGPKMVGLFFNSSFTKENLEDIFNRLLKFLSIFSKKVKPLSMESCEGPICKSRVGPALHLTLVNGNPLLLCQDCSDSVDDVGKIGEEEYKNLPINFSKGLLAGTGVALLGMLVWAIVVAYTNPLNIFNALVAVFLYFLIFKTMDYVQAKRTAYSLLVGGILTILGIMAGIYLGIFGSAFKEQEMESFFSKIPVNNPSFFFISLFLTALGVIPYFFIGVSGIKNYLKTLSHPTVEVISSFDLTRKTS